jgi:uncharacterized membrane protein YphA (DoxX/SURF4 family)
LAPLFQRLARNERCEGFEYHLLAIALALPLAIKGAGSYAIDRVLARMLNRSQPFARPVASAL